MSFRLDVFLHDLLSFDFAGAALMTLWISIAAMLLGLAIGLALALMQQSSFRLLRWLAWSYLRLFRGTPVLLQIIFAFNVLPGFGLILSGPVCAVLALGLHEAAYMAEIFRSGLGAVNTGQRDAARALGMSEWKVMRLVVQHMSGHLRIRAARFPEARSFDTFDFNAQPSLNKALVLELLRCEWIEKCQNCIARGPSGGSKAHIGIALGLVASGFNSLIVSDRNG